MNYNEISLGQYTEIYSILTNTEIDQEERLIYLCMLFDKDILNKPITEFKQLSNSIVELLKTEPIKNSVKDKYKLNGVTYKLHKDFGTLTTSQFIDFQNYLKNGCTFDKYNQVLSVFLIPEGETYNNGKYDIKQLQRDIDNHLCICDGLGIADFFLRTTKVFLHSFQKSLQSKMKKLKKEQNKQNNQNK